MKRKVRLLAPLCLLIYTQAFGQFVNGLDPQIGIPSLEINKEDYRMEVVGEDTFMYYIPKTFSLRTENNDSINTGKSGTLRSSSYSQFDLSHIPNSHEVDKTRDVGEINIIQGASPAGNLTYSIPIQGYPGRNNATPSISICYNSMGGNGIAGMGWGIGGLSCISGVNLSMYYDKGIAGIRMDKSGAFQLDGIRLIKLDTGNSYETNYETETGKIRVTAFHYDSSVIRHFTVKYPDGSKATFGIPSRNIQETQITYPITSVENLNGEVINYMYVQKGKVNYISEITYGGGVWSSPRQASFASIKFSYEQRNDTIKGFCAGIEFQQNQRLKEINVLFDNRIMQTYKFSYEYKNVSLLKKVELIAENKSFNPLIFYYGSNNVVERFDKSRTLLGGGYINVANSDMLFLKGKFDKSDENDALIAYPKISNYAVTTTKTVKNWLGNITAIYYQMGSLYEEDWPLFIYHDISSGTSMPSTAYTGKGFLQMIPLDIDGDGNDEIVKMNSNVINSSIEQIAYNIYKVKKIGLGPAIRNLTTPLLLILEELLRMGIS